MHRHRIQQLIRKTNPSKFPNLLPAPHPPHLPLEPQQSLHLSMRPAHRRFDNHILHSPKNMLLVLPQITQDIARQLPVMRSRLNERHIPGPQLSQPPRKLHPQHLPIQTPHADTRVEIAFAPRLLQVPLIIPVTRMVQRQFHEPRKRNRSCSIDLAPNDVLQLCHDSLSGSARPSREAADLFCCSDFLPS